MLPTEVNYLVRYEQYKDLLWEATYERLALAAERRVSKGLWPSMGDWMRQRMMPQLVIPTFHFYSK